MVSLFSPCSVGDAIEIAAPFPAEAAYGARAAAPGSCGELIQGVRDGRRLLVSCPVDYMVEARVQLGPHRRARRDGPPACDKARQGLERVLRLKAARTLDARFQLRGLLPRGRGMASSTADIVAVAAAALRALGEAPRAALLARLAAAIEPSDSIMFPGLCLMDSHTGEALELLGEPPALRILILDWGGRVDTLDFHRRMDARPPPRSSPDFEAALALLRAATADKDPRALAEATRLSACAHQSILPKPQLPEVEHLGRRLGAYGCNVAHSGTIIGLLLPDEPDRAEQAAAIARDQLPGLRRVTICRLCAGGIR